MKISQSTRDVLQNFATISPSIKLFPGSWIGAIDEERSVVARAAIPETLPREVWLDGSVNKRLDGFCQLLKLFGDDADVDFGEDKVTISAGRFKQILRYSDPATCKFQTLKGDPAARAFDPTFSFLLTDQDYSVISRASKLIDAPHLVLESEPGGKIGVTARNEKEKGASDEHVFDTDAKCRDGFRIVFAKKNLKMIPGDYEIAVQILEDAGKPPKFLSKWHRQGDPNVFYYVAVELGATYVKGE